ncbi:hypothetical protein Mycch_0420 [Mycolicibacterium chubuense NBB4]|uniref:Antibiotic biosynthesis monooxygenase n=1 Tax=Mycolicibacterium chubuense (strain NBB4) TaxID=710421 RepID=I4BD83_MYCCN|nr:antibiotic biosynthesis monooxygenase [Mycolicibacterium chubuense]AFM15240.1 hypothetical protein Mycch_0420 [Mycolicibacterium chubuense NBB4]
MPEHVHAITAFHSAGGVAEFRDWAEELLASAQAAPGHTSGRIAVDGDPVLDRAVAVTFSHEEQLHRWLDGLDREEVLRRGQQRGFWRSSGDVLLADDGPMTLGVGAFRHAVTVGGEEEFLRMQVRLARAAAGQPGYEGTIVLPADPRGESLSLVRFRTERQLEAWMRSAARTEALSGLRATLRKDFSAVSNTTPFATTVRTEDGRTVMTPNWKSAMLVLLVLYPTVMLLSRFLGPVLDGLGAGPWLGLWVSQIVSVTAMQWWLMPAASRPFRRWLDPIDGSGARISAGGAVVIVVLYAVTLTLFATVHELQFWDYAT